MIHFRNNFFIITGGPGAGKTAIATQLQQQGFCCTKESGRQIIQEQMTSNGNALPWEDKIAFRDMMLLRDTSAYISISDTTTPVFFDRGIPDLIGYSQLEKLEFGENLIIAVQKYRYNKLVFVAPPWDKIYCRDNERKQSYAEAVATYEALVKAYTDNNYELIEIPRTDVKHRADFILNKVKKIFPTV